MKTNATMYRLARLDKCLIDRAGQIVDSSGVVGMIEKWREDDGFTEKKGGRPRIIPLRSALIVMLCLGIQAEPHHVTRGRDILVHQTTKKAWEALGLPVRDYENRGDELESNRWYYRLWKSLHAVFDTFDPFPEITYGKRLLKSDYQELKDRRDVGLILKRKARGKVFANALVTASVKLFGEDRLGHWDGSVVVDGTPLEVAKRGLYKNTDVMPSTPDAGWYCRDGDHKADSSSIDKVMWGFEITLTAMHDARFGGEGKYPSLIVGMGMDKPGHRIAENALNSLDHIINDPGLPRGKFVGDRAYVPGAKAESLQIPLRDAGYKLVGDLAVTSHGVKAGYEGALQIDGHWHCPAVEKIPGFVNPWEDRENGRITQEEFESVIEERKYLQLRVKETRGDGSQKFQCPARGASPTAICPLVRNRKRAAKNPVPLKKLFDIHVPPVEKRGKVCTNHDSLVIPLTVGAKYAQQGAPWMSEEWKAEYQPSRATIESRNDLLKNARGAGIGDSTSRLMRGWAAQLFFSAVGVVTVNVRLIQAWLAKPSGTVNPPPRPPGGGEKLESFSLREVADSNAPPMAA